MKTAQDIIDAYDGGWLDLSGCDLTGITPVSYTHLEDAPVKDHGCALALPCRAIHH